MRFSCLTFTGGLIATLLASGMAAEPLNLIPAPRSVNHGAGAYVLRSPVRISVVSGSEDDRFAAGLFARELKEVHGLETTVVSQPGGPVLIGRTGTPAIDAEITRRKVDVSALHHPESYLLDAGANGVLVAAKTAEGIYYGVQTLRQLAGTGGRVPHVRIADWPALRYRALSIDINRGPLLTEEQMKQAVETAAEFKFNMVFFYLEHVFQYTHSALAAPRGGEVTADLIRRVSAHARRHHVELVPHQQLFGHLHNMLKFELYAGMSEIPHGSVLSPAGEGTYEWIESASRQLADAFPGKFLLVGSDETWELGRGRSRELAERDGVGGVYLKHLQKTIEIMRPLGRRLLFPGDIALKHPEMIPDLPKGLIAVTWAYSPLENYSKYIEPFRKSGMDFMVCTAVHNWNRLFPAFATTRPNVNVFARDGKNTGAMGLIASHWADDGEALFNMTWYGVVFSAAAAWQDGLVDTEAFDRSFDWAFYRNRDHTFVGVIRRLEQVHELLRSVRAGEANSTIYWTDPFSRDGAEVMRRSQPVASKMRLLAEEATLDLLTHGSKARHHAGTIRFLELAAKRIDYLGMKIQFANEIGELYRELRADPADDALATNNLRRIKGMDGLLPTLRDYSTEVKAAYREAWLAENRPYWLDNVLLDYDREALGWVDRIRFFESIHRRYPASREIPDLEPMGVFLP
jgi:hypothetical protein